MSVAPRARREHPQGPAHDGRALARLVSDPDAFPESWGERPLLARRAELPRAFDDLLDLDAVDELLSRRGLRTPFLRMAKDGAIVESTRFTRSGGAGAAVGDQVDDTAVMRLFADGTTIVLQALHRLWPPIVELAGALTGELGHPVQVNAYITPPSSRGFSAHYDIHDVFVLQLAGEKRWIVHEPVHPAPLRTQPWTQHRERVARAVAETEPVLDAVLKPGDALYLPRGFVHAAEALGDVSAHLTVGVHVVTRHALVEALLAEAENDVELRRSLPVGLDTAATELLADELSATVDALVEHLRGVDAESVLARLEASLADATRPSPIAPLRQIAAASGVARESRVRLRAGVRARLADTELRYPGGSLAVDPGLEEAVATLLEGDARAVGSLPGEAGAVAGLVRQLLLRGIVVPDD